MIITPAVLNAAAHDAAVHGLQSEALIALQMQGLTPEQALLALLAARRSIRKEHEYIAAMLRLDDVDQSRVKTQREAADALLAQAQKIGSPSTRAQALRVIEGGVENANDTCLTERAADINQWRSVFIGSCASLLCERDVPALVVKWFAARGIRA